MPDELGAEGVALRVRVVLIAKIECQEGMVVADVMVPICAKTQGYILLAAPSRIGISVKSETPVATPVEQSGGSHMPNALLRNVTDEMYKVSLYYYAGVCCVKLPKHLLKLFSITLHFEKAFERHVARLFDVFAHCFGLHAFFKFVHSEIAVSICVDHVEHGETSFRIDGAVSFR